MSMNIARYLPSTQFALIVSSIAISGGLVLAAQYYTTPHSTPAQLAEDTTNTPQNVDWQKTLQDIQAQSGVSLPPAPDPSAVSTLLQAAQSQNLTDTVGKTLFINISNAKAQGLGDDTPTQNELIAQALGQIGAASDTPAYSLKDLQITAESTANLHAFGNSMMLVLQSHPAASAQQTILAMGRATDNHDSSQLADLSAIGKEYKAIARDLANTPVPQTLAPIFLQVVNDYVRMANTYSDMQAVLDDPLRGLQALQLYESLMQETTSLLTSIAGEFSKNGILFNKDEPGDAWSSFLLQTQ